MGPIGLLLMVAVSLHAYHWEVSAAKTDPYVNEAVQVVYTCTFDDAAMNYTIEFHPRRQTPHYRLERLSEQESLTDGRRINRFEWVVFPTQAGPLSLTPRVLMRRTTRGSIENAIIGRDNVQDYQFTDENVTLPALQLDVRGHDATWFGRYTLTVDAAATQVDAFAPLQLTVRLEGVGNMDRIAPFALAPKGVHRFADAPQRAVVLTPEGYRGTLTQRFAFSADHNFTIPALHLRIFDARTGQPRELRSAPQLVEVVKRYDKKQLLDAEPAKAGGFAWHWWYLHFPLTFLLGVLIGWRLRGVAGVRLRRKSARTLQAKIAAASDVKTLLVLLALDPQRRFDPLIAEAERESWPLGRLKRAAAARL